MPTTFIQRRLGRSPLFIAGLAFTTLAAIALAVAGFANANVPQPSLQEESRFLPSDRQVRTAEEILRKLQRRHYEKRQFNDLMSSSLLDRYLDKLDPNKSYFTAEDARQFEPYRFQLDDEIRRGNLAPGFEIFNAYHSRLVTHLTDLVNTLPARVDALNFTLDESIETDPDKLPWAKDEIELKDRQRKNLKNTVLGMRLDDGFLEKLDNLLDQANDNTLQLTIDELVSNTDVERIFIAALPVTLESGALGEESKTKVHNELKQLLSGSLYQSLHENISPQNIASDAHNIVVSQIQQDKPGTARQAVVSEALYSAVDGLLSSSLASKTSIDAITANLDNALDQELNDNASKRLKLSFQEALEQDEGLQLKQQLIGDIQAKLSSNTNSLPDDDETRPAAVTTFKQAVLSSYIKATLEARYRDQLEQLSELNSDDVFNMFINTLAELFDPHTSYLAPKVSENFSIQMRLSLEGIGALLRRDGEYTVVQSLVPAGPADKQGQLKAGDKILGVGQGVKGDIVNVIGWRLDEVVELIRGKKASTVRLRVLPTDAPDSSSETVIQIVRNTVKLEEQAAKKDVLELDYGGEARKIGVITIPTFYIDFEGNRRGDDNYKSTTRDVTRLVRELQEEQVEGFIIDLRGNGGGSLQEVNQLLRLFLESGPVVQIRYSNGRIDPDGEYPNPDYVREPIAVLIDRLSASASEIFAGAIQDYERGVIVGSQSFGKGTVQQLAELSHGALKLTQAKFYRVSGESTQHRGVIPDVILPSLYDSQEIGENTLDNALNWDRIAGRQHRNYGDIDAVKYQLIERHKKRIADDHDFQYLLGRIALSEQYAEIKTWSLNEASRREFLEKDRRQREEIEANYKAANQQGEDPLSSAELLAGDESPAGGDNTDEEGKASFLLTETAHILMDSIHLQKQLAADNPSNKNSEPLAANQPQ